MSVSVILGLLGRVVNACLTSERVERFVEKRSVVLSLRQEAAVRLGTPSAAVVGIKAGVGVLNDVHNVLAVPGHSLVSHGVRIAQVEGRAVTDESVHSLLVEFGLVDLVIRSEVSGFVG